jgi:hypothetical protein
MKRALQFVFLVAMIAGGVFGYRYYDANRDFTPWMSEADLAVHLKNFDVMKPAGADPWEKTHWITAAEGRWHDGTAQYRIRYADAPKETQFVWSWFINMDQGSFSEKIQDYSKNGFKLVYHNVYRLPDGTPRYQGVWQKTGSAK